MYLREMRFDDALDLLQWKNDYQTRMNAIASQAIIYWTDHLGWLESRLKKPGFYLICEDEEKLGWIRFDIAEEEIEVAVVIAPKHRGKGIASNVVGLAASLVQLVYKKTLMAKIVDGNMASWRAFTEAGFVPCERKEENGKKYTVLRRGC